jgi:hypothetical protein
MLDTGCRNISIMLCHHRPWEQKSMVCYSEIHAGKKCDLVIRHCVWNVALGKVMHSVQSKLFLKSAFQRLVISRFDGCRKVRGMSICF